MKREPPKEACFTIKPRTLFFAVSIALAAWGGAICLLVYAIRHTGFP